MKHGTKWIRLVVALLLGRLTEPLPAQNIQLQEAGYTFTHIDVPGAQIGPLGANGTLASGINDLGQIVGSYVDSAGLSHGFLRDSSGGFTTFDVPGAGRPGTVPTGINNNGEIVGWYQDSSGLAHGFLYNRDAFSNIDMTTNPCAGSVINFVTQATGINNKGDIVGDYAVSASDPPGCPPPSATPGFGFPSYFGIFLDLADVGGGTGTFAAVGVNGVNNSGQMVGYYAPYKTCPGPGGTPYPYCGGAGDIPFVGAPGTPFLAPFGSPNLYQYELLGINDNGQVVGNYLVPVGVATNLLASRGFIYYGAGSFNLLDPPATWGATSSGPVGINNNRQIVGTYVNATGNHSFLATPNCADGILKVWPTGANIDASFAPAGGLSLQELAQQCGFVGFNWTQLVTHQDDPSEFYANNIGGAFDPSIKGIVNLDSARIPFSDPPQGGGYACTAGVCRDPSPDFSYPFYYDAVQLADQEETPFVLKFHDASADGCLPGGSDVGTPQCNYTSEPPESFSAFTTRLVGINADGTPADLGMGFNWISNYNGTAGEVHVLKTDLPADGNGTGGVTITSVQGAIIAPVDAINVLIEIKPPSATPVPIQPLSQGEIPVAVLTTTDFDASTVDPTTVRFGASGAQRVSATLEDINGDGKLDLVLHFETQATGIKCGDTRAALTGKTVSGQLLFGSETIVTVGCP